MEFFFLPVLPPSFVQSDAWFTMKCWGLLMLGITLNAAVSDAKIYTRCQLAKELFYQGISKTFISNCKRFVESFFRFLMPRDFRGLLDWGWVRRRHVKSHRISQSQHQLWSLSGELEGVVSQGSTRRRMQCALRRFVSIEGQVASRSNRNTLLDLLNEDIKDDIKCAKTIYSRHGFKHWKGWQNRCKARPLPDVSKCKMSSY